MVAEIYHNMLSVDRRTKKAGGVIDSEAWDQGGHWCMSSTPKPENQDLQCQTERGVSAQEMTEIIFSLPFCSI